MSKQKGFINELLERRIPQIIGMYIAAMWLAMEMADWMSERFDVSVQLSSYVFVVMVSFVPLVALLAWGHGRPGKDKWTQKQIIFIPFNIVLAYFAVTAFIKPETGTSQEGNNVQATEIMALTDVHTGEVVEYEVAKTGLSQKVVGFFWNNHTGDASLDWLSYGSMWMVAKDLMRNPIISIRTPYDSPSMLRAITSKGFDRAVGQPLSLNLDIAGDREAQWMIGGQITKTGEQVTFEASLYDALTGNLVTTISSTYDDWLYALDDLAEQLATLILDEANIPTSIIPERPLSEYISNKLPAIEWVIKSLNAVNINNDYVEGLGFLEKALTDDEQMAEAYVLMMDYYRMMGDVEGAKKAAEAALKLEYKLSFQDSLKVKANYYAVDGDLDKAIKVLENWVKLEPESADALEALGSNYIIIGNRLDDALEVYEKLSQIQKTNSTALKFQARIYRLKDNQEKALKALQLWAKNSPKNTEPLLEMAAAYIQFGELDKAQEVYEQASLLSINGVSADLGLAKIMALKGEIEESLQAFDGLLDKAATDPAKVNILEEKEVVYNATGRLKEAFEVVLQAKVISESYMMPLQHNLMYGAKEVAYLAYLGDFEGSHAKLKAVKKQINPPYDNMLDMAELTIHELTGDDEQAAETLHRFEQFIKTLDMDYYDQFIIAQKAIQARKAGDYELALKLHNQAIADSKQSFLTLNTLNVLDDMIYKKALTLYEMGQYEDTIQSLQSVLKRNPILGQGKVLAAKAMIKLNQLDQAQQVINEVKQLWANANSEFQHLTDLQEVEAMLDKASS
jgi:tetratricopeptide (TPR) repeat protein